MVGRTINQYKILNKLGQGGMGVVYRAEDTKLERIVALKFLPANLAASDDAKARFLREARAAAALQHPNICTVHEIGEADGKQFIAMALIDGSELGDQIEKGPLEVQRLLDTAIGVAEGLQEAHHKGVTHRDIKPSNILVSADGRPVLMDFGLAQLSSASSRLTREGTTVGTSSYMSPEQTTGEALDHRTDIWSFGVVLYEMATGELPFRGHYEQAVLYSILNEAPEPVATLRSDAPDQLERVINKCLAKRADERYQTTAALLTDLIELKRQVESGVGPVELIVDVDTAQPKNVLVGREAETAELGRLLDAVGQGSGALVLIGGEPGVGKTRLCQELLAEAGKKQMLVLVGHSYEGEGAQPFIPFVESLEQAARTVPRADLRTALGDAGSEIAKLMPELRRIFRDISEPIQLPPEQQRRYLFNSFQDFTTRLSNQRPIVWLLDDLHWADDSSLLLLQHFAQNLATLPVLILGTYRDIELEVGKPFEKALAQLVRQRLARRMALKRLPEASVADLIASLAGDQPPESLVQVIYQETEGNPFFVEEVFQHLSEEGKLFDEEGRWRADLRAEELEVPEGVRLVVGRRLERLSPRAPKILAAAAVIGRVFELSVLEGLEGLDSDDVLEAVEEAETAELLTTSPTGRAVRYQFTHELIRHTLLSGLSLPRRQRMHLRVANALEKKDENNVGPIAHHLFQAGMAADLDKAVRYLNLAGRRSLAAAAPDEAFRYFDDAISLEPTAEEGKATLLHGRGRSNAALGRAEYAVRDFEEALPIFENLGQGGIVATICRDLTQLLSFSFGRLDDAIAISSRGLKAVGDAPSTGRCRLLATRAAALSIAQRFEEAESGIQEAAAMAEVLGDKSLEVDVYRCKAQHDWFYMRLRAGTEAGERAVKAARSAGDLWGLADALAWTCIPLRFMGRVEEARSVSDELELVATRVGHFTVLWNVRATNMYQLLFDGDLDGLEANARETLQWCLDLGIYWGVCQTYALLGLTELWRWRYDKAHEYALRSIEAEGEEAVRVSSRPTLMLVQAYAGKPEALEQVPHIELPRVGEASHIGQTAGLLFLVEALAVLGEDERAAALYPLLAEPLKWVKIGCFGAMMPETAAGISAAAGRQWDNAAAHFETALRYAEDVPHKLEQPQVRYWYAKMLVGRGEEGDHEKARSLLDKSVSEFTALGMPRHLEMAQALIAAT